MPTAFDLDTSKKNLRVLLDICARPGTPLVLMQNNPDPDSLACAAALRDIAAVRLKKRIRIGYGGICGRAENRAMMKVLDIDARHVSRAEVAQATTICLVDSQPRAGNNLLFTEGKASIVLDHHILPKRMTWKAELMDVRPGYGATSTILYEYVRVSGIKISANLATALFYGIRSDTQDLGREASISDVRAFQELSPHIDRRKLTQIGRAPVPAEYFATLSATLNNCIVAGKTVVGYVPENGTPDMIAELADMLLRLEGMHCSVCYGLCGGVVHISARRPDARGDVARLVKRVVGRMGSGGGHRAMAGAQVPVSGDPEKCIETLRKRILDVFAPHAEPRDLLSPTSPALPSA